MQSFLVTLYVPILYSYNVTIKELCANNNNKILLISCLMMMKDLLTQITEHIEHSL